MSAHLSTHASRLERWLGHEALDSLVVATKDWYGPPIAVAGVPGNVWAMKGGDFRGRISAGQFANALDFGLARAGRILRDASRLQASMPGAGFASFSALVAAATTGKRREIAFNKTGATGVVAVTNSLFGLGAQPAAGEASSAAPGGIALNGTTAGAIYGLDAVSADTRHLVSAWATASVAGQTLMLYDRLFGVAIPLASVSGATSITGVPTRYQSATATDANYAGGNFAFIEVGATAIAATAHNWTVCRYRNQAGTDQVNFPSMTGNSGAIARRLDHPVSSWFMPLAAGDTGVMDLDQVQASANMATGLADFVIGHPLAIMPVPLANIACQYDGLNTAFNLVRVFDGAALALLEISKPSTTATTYNGGVTFVHA